MEFPEIARCAPNRMKWTLTDGLWSQNAWVLLTGCLILDPLPNLSSLSLSFLITKMELVAVVGMPPTLKGCAEEQMSKKTWS